MSIEVDYWTDFYSSSHTLETSRFCNFVLDFFRDHKTMNVLDAGCGNGRDSYGLSTLHKVVGLDTSKFRPESRDRCVFEEGDFCHYDKDNFDLIYSRFTLHSITNEQQIEFLSSINKSGTYLCIEARSDKDINNFREHGDDHYRNFINFTSLISTLEELNFDILHAEEGQGLAPYKTEDPYCVRFIVEKI